MFKFLSTALRRSALPSHTPHRCSALALCLALSACVPVLAQNQVQNQIQSQGQNQIQGTAPASPSAAALVFRAMRDEMQRSMNELRLPALEKPYFMQYTLLDAHVRDIRASFGSLTESKQSNSKRLNVAVRVGSPAFDNTNFFDPALGFFGSSDDEERFRNRSVPAELDYAGLRRELWLASDAAYKQVAELFSKKQAALRNRVRLDTLPDFTLLSGSQTSAQAGSQTGSQREAFVSLADTSSASHVSQASSASQTAQNHADQAYLESLATRLSAVFCEFPAVNLSNVTIQYTPETAYILTSEGRECVRTTLLCGVEIVATAQAPDGMPLAEIATFYAKHPSDLPSADSLLQAARTLARTLSAASKAPRAASYSGPILFEDQAAGEVIVQGFAPYLAAQRSPVTERGVSDNPRFAAFQNKIGGRVLPEFLSVWSKPNLASYESTPLVGAFRYDDETVAAEPLRLVAGGYLKTLLSSRTPTRRMKASNGRNRGGAAMFDVIEIGRASEDENGVQSTQKMNTKSNTKTAQVKTKKNVVSSTKASQGSSNLALRQRLLALCKDRELPFGIVVRRILNQNILYYNLYTLTDGEFPFAKGEGQMTALEAYKIFPDGREELIRGCDVVGLGAAAFKDIIAVGTHKTAYNCLAQSVTSAFFSGGSQFLPVSVITPALLFEDLELRPVEDDFAKPPILSNPLFSIKQTAPR
jgi:TldD protein